jgi:hypothetical protein
MAEQDDSGTPPGGGGAWSRALDVAGVLAGVLLVAMAADMITDGRLISRRLLRRQQPPAATDQPPEGDDG